MLIYFFLKFFFFLLVGKKSPCPKKRLEVGLEVGTSSGIFFLSLLDFRTAGRISFSKEASKSGSRSFIGSMIWSITDSLVQIPLPFLVSFSPTLSPSHNPSEVFLNLRWIGPWPSSLFLFNLKNKRVLKSSLSGLNRGHLP